MKPPLQIILTRRCNRVLKVGDRIKVWWSSERQTIPNIVTISRLERYQGPLQYLWPTGARLVDFQESRVGTTLANDDYSDLLVV